MFVLYLGFDILVFVETKTNYFAMLEKYTKIMTLQVSYQLYR